MPKEQLWFLRLTASTLSMRCFAEIVPATVVVTPETCSDLAVRPTGAAVFCVIVPAPTVPDVPLKDARLLLTADDGPAKIPNKTYSVPSSCAVYSNPARTSLPVKAIGPAAPGLVTFTA